MAQWKSASSLCKVYDIVRIPMMAVADKTELIAKQALFPRDAALMADSLGDTGRWLGEPK